MFMKAFYKISEQRFEQWENEGKIITSKQAIAKDWNEYLQYQKKKPEFRNYLESLELEFNEKYSSSNSNPNTGSKRKLSK